MLLCHFQRWQRRYFVLYDDGELNYSVDEHVSTLIIIIIIIISYFLFSYRHVVLPLRCDSVRYLIALLCFAFFAYFISFLLLWLCRDTSGPGSFTHLVCLTSGAPGVCIFITRGVSKCFILGWRRFLKEITYSLDTEKKNIVVPRLKFSIIYIYTSGFEYQQ